MYMEINQLVTRISHKHDVVFRVVNIVNGIATLRGEVIRLICDAPLNDLKTFEEKGDSVISFPSLRQASFTRNEVLKGKVLHIDGDEYYLQKAVEAYRQYGIPAVGYFIDENEMPKRVLALLKKHQPNILVITGHDAIEGKGHDLTNIDSYRNSKFLPNA